MEKAVKPIFIFLLMLFPLGQIGRVELGGGVNILVNDFIVFLTVLVWFFAKLISRKPFTKRPLAKPIAIFVLVALFSLIIHISQFPLPQFLTSALYLVRWIFYACLYFVVSDFDKAFRNKILYGLAVSGVVTMLLGFVQYFLYPNLRNLYYAGWDEHLYRLFSSFLDPNFAGGIFVLTFLLSLFLSFPRSVNRIPLPKWKRSYTSGIFVMIAVISFVALLLTYSRGSFLAFVAGILVFLLLSGRKKFIFLLLAIFVGGIILLPKNLGGEGVKLLRTVSINERLKSMEHAINIFKDSPILGVGFNTYRYVQFKYKFITEEELQQSHAAAGADNSFLFVLATTGIIGFLFYCYLWLRVVGEVRGNALVLASIASIFVHAFFVNSLFYPQILEWMWILIGASTVEKSL